MLGKVIQKPLTTDKNVTLRSLKDIKYNNIIEGGTAIGMVLLLL